jgi:hypothetical protein
MAEVLVDAPGGAFSGGGNTATGINPGGHFSGDGTGGTIGQGLNDSILWIGPAPPDPGATQFVLWINTADGRWYGKWNDGTSSQWVDLSLPFGEGKRGPIGLQGDKGDAGDVGPTGNSVIYGVVAPTTEGIDGDTYLDSATSTIYGPKAGGTWPAGVSLIGATGNDGVDGTDGTNGTNGTNGTDGFTIIYGTVAPTTEGVDGDTYIDSVTDTIYGPKAGGTWPAGTSLVGPAGADGTDGTDGTDGSGVVVGGTTGQVLAKIDATDYNTEWVDQSGGVTTLGALTDVDLATTAPTDTQALIYDDGTSTWIPGTITSSSSEPNSLSAPTERLTNGDFETGDATGWTVTTGAADVQTFAAATGSPAMVSADAQNGAYLLQMGFQTSFVMNQSYTLTANDTNFTFKAVLEANDPTETDAINLLVEQLDSGSTVIDTQTWTEAGPGGNGVVQILALFDRVPGAASIKVTITGTKGVAGTFNNAYIGFTSLVANPVGGGNTLYSTGLARSTGLKTSSWTLDSPNGLSTILAKKAGTTTQIWSSAGNPVGVNIANPVGINDDFDVIFDTFVYQHNDNFLMSGVYVEDVGVRQLMGTFYWNGNYGWQRYNNLVFSSENDTTTPTFSEFAYPMLGVKCYFRIIRVGDALTYYASPTGLGAIGTWDLMTTQSMSARGITDVTKIGVYSQAAAMSGTKDQGSILVGFDSGLQVENILNITETNKKVVIADYTLTDEDFFGGQILVFNSIDNITVTIPEGLTTYGPVTIISNNANTVTFVGASGVEVIGNLQLATEDSVASVVPLETDAFHMVGNVI